MPNLDDDRVMKDASVKSYFRPRSVMIRSLVILRVLLMSTIAAVPAVMKAQTSPRPAAVPDGDQRNGDAAMRRRVGTWIAEIADVLPQLAARVAPHVTWGDRDKPEDRAARKLTGQALRSSPPLMRLDSLRILWSTTPGQLARTKWLLDEPDGVGAVTQAIIELAAQRVSLPQTVSLSTSAKRTAGLVKWRDMAQRLTASSIALMGAGALGRGDTVGAMDALSRAARMPLALVARPSGMVLMRIAHVRGDTTQWFAAMTLAFLEIGRDDLEGKTAIYTQLSDIFPRYLATRGIPPDVVPGALAEPADLKVPLTLDAYLDRQFAALYGRAFPVQRAEDLPVGPADDRRLVVLEYATGVTCGGCWTEDRAFDAIGRRYGPDNVVPLGYHGWNLPLSNLADSTWNRFDAWYPQGWPNEFAFRGHLDSRIPRRALLSPAGDTLRGEGWVDGHLLPAISHQSPMPLPQQLYQAAVTQVDRDIQRPPEAMIRLEATRLADSIGITVRVDSLTGNHSHLTLRIVLFEDTVRLRGATNRRVYQNVVRAEAQSDGLSLGLPLPANDPSTSRYAFDLATLQAQLAAPRDPVVCATRNADDGKPSTEDIAIWRNYVDGFPDARDWQIDPSRLHVVAFVQDLDTGEVLQAARMKIPESAQSSAAR